MGTWCTEAVRTGIRDNERVETLNSNRTRISNDADTIRKLLKKVKRLETKIRKLEKEAN